jgi:pimeloyl-ACP methyl ester carboxylesterase
MKHFLRLVVALCLGPCLAAGNSHYANVNGLRMYYETHGDATPGRPPLVLLHGGSATIDSTFVRLLPLLAANRAVIAIEQQGHGHTADIDRPLGYAQMADDTAALLATLKAGPVDCLGFSDGANVALQLAIRHPDAVRKIVAAGALVRADAMKPESVAFIRAATAETWPPPVKAAYMRAAPDPQHWAAFIGKVKTLWLEMPDWPEDSLRAIRTPVLLVYGDHDDIRLEHAVQLQGLIPAAQLAVLPATSHFMLIERADEVSRMTIHFLDAGK